MKIGILGYGKEGQSAEKYFQKHQAKTVVFDHFSLPEIQNQDFSDFDLIIRSPSIHPQAGWSSSTRYFFEHCPCPIIGVTGTKGKGTTCSLITALLESIGKKVYLVGNIGNPAIDVLDELKPDDVVVYEMSSFQLWDLEKSPRIAVVLGIEPDHLNIHDDFDDYVQAKTNICKHQTAQDCCIFYNNNAESRQIAEQSPAQKIGYPLTNRKLLDQFLPELNIPGQHNRENAEAALLATSAFLQIELNPFLEKYQSKILQVFRHFQGLPHRLQFLRELNHVRYYDDNFSTTPTSTAVALAAFPKTPLIVIAGGRDKTANADLPEIVTLFQTTPNLQKLVLIGESGHELAKLLPADRFVLAESLAEAVASARALAESLPTPSIVLMSPAAASFDMFENVYDRGAQFQKLVQEL